MIHKSMSLKHEPSSEPLGVHLKADELSEPEEHDVMDHRVSDLGITARI